MKNIKDRVDEIVQDGKITKAEFQELKDVINRDGKIDDQENAQITRVLDMIDNGQLRVV